MPYDPIFFLAALFLQDRSLFTSKIIGLVNAIRAVIGLPQDFTMSVPTEDTFRAWLNTLPGMFVYNYTDYGGTVHSDINPLDLYSKFNDDYVNNGETWCSKRVRDLLGVIAQYLSVAQLYTLMYVTNKEEASILLQELPIRNIKLSGLKTPYCGLKGSDVPVASASDLFPLPPVITTGYYESVPSVIEDLAWVRENLPVDDHELALVDSTNELRQIWLIDDKLASHMAAHFPFSFTLLGGLIAQFTVNYSYVATKTSYVTTTGTDESLFDLCTPSFDSENLKVSPQILYHLF